MKLTGKCRADFNKWLDSKYAYNIVDWERSRRILKEAFCLEFFDLRGLYIDRLTPEREVRIWDYRDGEPDKPIVIDTTYTDRCEEYHEAIEKANDLYNNKNLLCDQKQH